MQKLLLATIIGLSVVIGGFTGRGIASPEPRAAEKEKEQKRARSIPFHGKIDQLDKDAKTMKVGSRTFHAASDTRFVKAGKPATFADAVVGDEVGGAYREGEGGKLELVSLRLGAKPEKEGAPKKE